MEKNGIKSNKINISNKNSAPIIISTRKQQNLENETRDVINKRLRDETDEKSNFKYDEKIEENKNNGVILSNGNNKNDTINTRNVKNNYGKEVVVIEKVTTAPTGNSKTGPHVVKIRVNPNQTNTTNSSSSLSAAATTVSQQPVQLESFSSFLLEERGPAAFNVAPRTSTESSTNIENNQSSSNTVRINIGTGSSSSSTRIKTTSNQERSRSTNMVPSPLPPNGTYYYNTSSTYEDNGQVSPTSDSGTCSDLDSSSTLSPLPKIKKEKTSTPLINNDNKITLPITQTSKVTITSAITKNANHQHDTLLINHQRGSSLTSSGADVEESDDDVSCDSLNSGELELLNNNMNNNHSKTTKIIEFTRKILQNNHNKNVPVTSELVAVNEDNVVKTNVLNHQHRQNGATTVVEERTYEERNRENNKQHRVTLKSTTKIATEDDNSIDSSTESNKSSSKITTENEECSLNNNKSNSENFDSFYKFHLNENNFDSDRKNNLNRNSGENNNNNNNKVVFKNGDCVNNEEDVADYFAGCKNYNETCDPEMSTIRSSKGTIRGVKNRVRAGIATFLQIHATKSWQEKEAGKVVVYTTTMGIVRETYQRCLKVRQILRTHLVKFDEKDVFMSREIQTEIRERMGSDNVSLPQMFVEGQHIGDAETIERLNETGELRRILKPYKSPDACTTCKVCGGYRLLPCPVCNGSKKSVHRNHFTTELVALKCMNCDEVGLIRCYNC